MGGDWKRCGEGVEEGDGERERETPALTVMRSLPWAAGLCLLGLLKEGVERDPENCLSAG